MFQFPPLALHTYGFSMQCSGITRNGLSHSEIPGSTTVSVFPRLIAGNHVLLRLLVPRHPPYALSNFTYFILFAHSLVIRLSADRCINELFKDIDYLLI
jgi:hypothetical protein